MLRSLSLALLLSGCASADGAPPAPAPSAPERVEGAKKLNERWVSATPDDARETLERDGREVFAAREAVIDAVDPRAGEVAADIGAGSGFFVKMLAERVGPKGRVYGVDIAPALIEELRRWAEAKGAKNVEAVLGTPDDVRLPANTVDVAFTSDTYHHFERPAAVLASLREAMKPGARLFVLDFERIEGESAEWILGHVRAGKAEVLRELEAAGFAFVREHDVKGLEENYLVELRAPDDDER